VVVVGVVVVVVVVVGGGGGGGVVVGKSGEVDVGAALVTREIGFITDGLV
jgi:hypothetical protein